VRRFRRASRRCVDRTEMRRIAVFDQPRTLAALDWLACGPLPLPHRHARPIRVERPASLKRRSEFCISSKIFPDGLRIEAAVSHELRAQFLLVLRSLIHRELSVHATPAGIASNSINTGTAKWRSTRNTPPADARRCAARAKPAGRDHRCGRHRVPPPALHRTRATLRAGDCAAGD